MALNNKCKNPFEYDTVAEGFTCLECGRVQVSDELNAFLWCINKACLNYSVLLDRNYKEE